MQNVGYVFDLGYIWIEDYFKDFILSCLLNSLPLDGSMKSGNTVNS